MAVARRAELVRDARKPGTDVVGHQLTAALSQAEHLPCTVQQLHRPVHCFRGKGVLRAVDGGHEQRAGVLTEGRRISIGFRIALVDHCSCGVGLCQRDAHFMVTFEPQRPAEAEHGCFCYLALSGKG